MNDFNADSEALSQKLKEWSENELTEEQKVLLRAMLGVARGITGSRNGDTPPNLVDDFNKAFEPLPEKKVEMLLKYKDASPGMIVHHEDIVASNGNGNTPYSVSPRHVR